MIAKWLVMGAALVTGAASVPALRSGEIPDSETPSSEIADSDTRAWWQATEALSGDAMEGRDTGSPGYDRAARLLAARFAAAGLKPAGENGSWYQQLKLIDLTVDARATHFRIGAAPLRLLHDITLRPSPNMPRALDAPLVFRGYCGAGTLGDVRGKVVLCYGWRRSGLTSAAERAAAVEAAGALGIVTIADPGFTIEPMQWPVAYARSVAPVGAPAPNSDRLLVATLNPAALPRVLAGSGQDAATLIRAGSTGAALPNFNLPAPFAATVTLRERMIASANVLGLLPGSDSMLRDQYVVLSAHLDGYGRGEPVKGDGLYNGTLDDAAYVALLQRLAERRQGKGYRRSVVFAAFTGEEKGLLGATEFVAHPTVPRAALVANINLDQLRPIFPLDLMTVHALDDTTLGDAVRASAGNITVQHDPEPERNLLRRADHWPFLSAGIPATGFVFGYRTGTESEQRYRHWYQTGYHKPQDDLDQPMDWTAATKFNAFFYDLVARVADADRPPEWKRGSTLRPERK
ncbi:M28 family peptidase [Sphingomonas sp.]|uniref:M28 family peptidase n=1 Tax=Sphingomonas sp. TaxID=28214 RepID=UPI003D6D0FA2